MRFSLLISALWFFGLALRGQEPGGGGAAGAGPGLDKALKYYDALIKRPAAGYLFDRFYNSWVDAQTIEDLEKFLKEKATGPAATTNQRLVLAFFYAKQNEHPKALEQFRLALEKDPGNADAWFQKANAEVRTLDFESAIADLVKALDSKPNAEMTRAIQQLQGKLLARTGKNEEAMKVWQALIGAKPEDEELQEDLIELQINEGLNKEALATAEALLGRTKDAYKKVQRRLRIGDIQSRLGNRDEAIATYVVCLDEVGGDSWLEKEILSQIEQTFRRDDAIDSLKTKFGELIAKYPQRITLRRAQARLLVELGDADGAIKSFQAILAITPGDRELREAYVALLADSQKLDEAVAQLQQLISQHPQDGELLVKLAELYSAAGKKEEAQKTLENFLAKSDQAEQTFLRVAALLDRFKLGAASLALYKTSTEKFPDSDAAKENYAVALHREGKKEEALAEWRKMAAGGDRTRVMNVARQAAAREEHALAYELLSARQADFGNEALFFVQLCEAAQRMDKSKEAIPFAMKLVSLSHDAIDLDSALSLAAKLIERAEQADEQIKLLQASAKSAQERCLLAELLERSGDSKGAEALLKQVSTDQPEMGTALLVRLQTTRGDYLGASETMQKLVETPGGRKPVYVQRLVELFEKAGLLDKALTWVPEWKQLTPGSTQAWLKEADLKASLGKMKEALLTLRQATQQFEGNEDIRAQLGAAYRSEGKLADAERVFTQLYEEAKDNAAKVRWAGELAATAEQSGKMSELVDAFEERRRSNRTSVLPLLALAEIYRVADNYEARRQVLLEAARIKRDDIDLLLEISRIAEGQGDFDNAIQTLKDALPLDKTDKVKNRMARVLFAAGRDEEAKKLLFDLAGGAKMDPRVAESLAEGLLNQDDWPAAAELLEPIVAKFPKDYRLAYQYAVALEESGKASAALAEFQRILTLKEELPSRPGSLAATSGSSTVATRQARQASWLDIMRELLPARALAFLELTQYAYQATNYRQQNNGRTSGLGTKIMLPSDVEDAPKFALAHISMLAPELDEAAKARLDRDLKSTGLLSTEMLALLQGGRFNYNNPDFTELSQKHPEDETINALSCLYSAYNQTLSDEDRLRLFAFFKESRPLLASVAVITQGRSDSGDVRKAFAEAVALVEKTDKPVYVLVEAIGRLLNTNAPESGEAEEDAIYKDQVRRLRAKLMAWYRTEDRNNPYTGQLLNIVLQDLLKQEDPAELIALFEEEITTFQEQSGKGKPVNPMSGMYYSGRSANNNSITAATFPPEQLPDFPPFLLSLFGDANSNYYARNWQPDSDKLKAALAKVKNPILKALLANKVEDEAAVAAALQSMTEAKEAMLSPLLLSATWAAKKERWDEAILQLKKVEYLPLTKEQRRTVDASVLSWMLQKLDGGKELDEKDPVAIAAREAALRLRRDTLSGEQKQELAEAMERLGLAAEAKRLTAALNASAANSSRGSSGVSMFGGGGSGGGYGGGSFNPGTTSRIDALLQKGKADAVVKVWEKQLKDLSKAWSTSFNDSLQYQAREWLQVVRQKMSAAEADLIKSMQPAAGSTDSAAYAQLGAALEIFGKRKEAKEQYLKALELKPGDSNLRLVYVVFLMKESPAEAAAMLGTLDPKVIAKSGAALGGMIDNLVDNNQRCALARLVESFLTSLPPADYAKTDLTWLPYFVEQFARYGSERNGDHDLPSLYQKLGQEDREAKDTAEEKREKKARDEMQAERRKIHDAICLSAMKIPQIARFAFSKLAGLAIADGKSFPDQLEAAKEALKTEFGAKNLPASMNGNNGYTYDDDDDVIDFPSPEEVVLQSALKQGSPSLINDDVLPMLKNLKAQQAARDLEADAKLFFCEPDSFIAAAQSYVQRRATNQNPAQQGLAWGMAIQVMGQRGISVDLVPPILSGLKKNIGTNYGGSELYHIGKYERLLLNQGKKEEARDFLSKVAEMFLGPEDKRGEFLKKNFSTNYSSNSAGAAIYKWLSIFRNVGGNGNYVMAMVNSYSDEFARHATGLMTGNQYFYINRNRLFLPEPNRTHEETVLAFLKETPFLNDAAGLRLHILNRPESCAYGQIFEAVRNSPAPSLKKIIKLLEAEPKTLGTKLALAFLDSDGKVWENSLNAIGTALETLKAQPEDRQNEWSAWLKLITNYGGNRDRTKLAEDGKAALAWLQGLGGNAAGGKMDSLLAAKNLQALRLSEYNLRDLVEELLPGLLAKDAAKASAVLMKLRELVAVERKSRSGGSSYSYSDGSSAVGYAVGNVLDKMRSDTAETSEEAKLNALNVYAAAVCLKTGFPLEYGSNGRNGVRALLTALGMEEANGKKKFSLQKFMKLVGAKLSPDQSRLYVAEIGAVISAELKAMSKEDRKSSEAWLDEQAGGNEPHAWLAILSKQSLGLLKDSDDFAAAKTKAEKEEADKAKAEKREALPVVIPAFKGELDAAKLAEPQKSVLAVAELEAWSPIAKFTVLHNASEMAKETAEPALRLAAARLLIEAWRTQASVSSSDASRVMRRLTSWAMIKNIVLPDEFKNVASEVLAAWRRSLQARNNSSTASSIGPAALELACAVGDTGMVNQIVNQAGDGATRTWVAKLVSAKQFEAAKRLIVSSRENLFSNSDGPEKSVMDADAWIFTKDLEAALPEFLKTLESPQSQFVARVLLSSISDSKAAGQVPSLPRGKRLAALAKDFPADLSNNPELNEQLLQFVLFDEESRDAIPPEILKKVGESISLASVPDLNNSTIESRKKQLCLAYLASRVKAGDLAPVEKTLNELATAESQDSYDLRRLGNEVMVQMRDQTDTAWAKFDAATRKADRVMWRSLLFNPGASRNFDRDNNRGGATDFERLVHVLMIHAVDNAIPEFNEAYAAVGKDWKEHLAEKAGAGDLATALGKLNKLEPKPDKSDFFLKMMQTALPPLGSKKIGTRYFRERISKGFITEAVFLANGETFAKEFPNGGLTLLELAEVLERNGDTEKSVEMLRRSKAVPLEPDTRPDIAAWIEIMRAECYQRVGLLQDAVDSLNAISKETLQKLEDEKHDTIKVRSRLLIKLAQEIAISKGDLESAFQTMADQLKDEPDSAPKLEQLGTLFETVGDAMSKNKDLPAARQYYAASLLAYHAAVVKNPALKVTNQNRANNNYHRIGREMANPNTARQIVPRKSAIWRYLDGGTTPPADWTQPSLDVSGWKEGKSPIGYGEKDLGTEISPGGDAKHRPMTCYFRTTLTVPENVIGKRLLIMTRRDDGVVFYLDGKEAARSNMPEGPVKATTPALKKVGDDVEQTYQSINLSDLDLKPGPHILAAEVHQSDEGSSDLTLDVELVVNPSYVKDTAAGLDLEALQKTLGIAWVKLPEATKAKLINAMTAPDAVPPTASASKQEKASPVAASGQLPEGIPVSGKPGYVFSPFASGKGMIDVSGLPKGTKVECPYTSKKFLVP